MNKFYVTTSIPYVNGTPHVGHAMEFIQADVLARYHKQLGEKVLFGTGTDEHGGKNAEKAAALGISPKRYVDQISLAFKDLCTALDIDYDNFIRTTDKKHRRGVHQVWEKLSKFFYKNVYIGMYDQKEEEFISLERAREIHELDPVRYGRLQKTEEENYFFKLSEFTEPIKKAIESGEFQIVPKKRKKEIMALLEQGLEDISVSRPKDKIPWGIDVPGDDTQTIYVWFEALMNYITQLGYPDGKAMEFWPANAQVIGKDISRFHAAIWPAMLLGLGLELPKVLFVHGFITLDGKVMSKSVGNVVAPLEIISAYGSDAARYYFLRHIPSYDDGDFSWKKFERAYNGELGNDLGNLVQRLSAMINRYQDGVIGDIPEDEHDEGRYHEALEEFRFDKALDAVWSMIKGVNQYIDEQKPWQVAKEGDDEHLREILAYGVGSLLQVSKLLTPFMPKTGQAMTEMFREGVVKNYKGVLFPRVNNYTES